MSRRAIGALAAMFGRPQPVVGATPADAVHRENKWKLLRYRSREERSARATGTPIVLIPSLINRHYVLDLMPGKSFVEDLVERGHDVYCIDWGTPADEDRYVTFDDICDRAIGRAIRVASRIAGTEKAHVLGYCLGGTLAAIHAAAHPEKISSLTLVAAPVAFADDSLLSHWTRSRTFDVDALVRATGNVPWPLMQAAFHMLRPTLGLAKTVTVAHRAVVQGTWDDPFLDGFFALETWGNDNVSFPGAAYATYIDELYRKDSLIRGEFRLSGVRVDLAAIRCPAMIVTFEHDNIVPWQSASVLVDRISSEQKHHVHLPGGHVGAMVSSAGKKKLWPAMSAFWRGLDGAAEEAAVEAAILPPVRKTTLPRARAARAARVR
jgi:polyhydroxyalkanoate synthase